MAAFRDGVFHWLGRGKDAIEAVQSIATTGAIVVGGLWAYLTFSRKREKFPRATLSHTAHLIRIDADRYVIRVNLEVENISDNVLEIGHIKNRLQQVTPLASIGGGATFDPTVASADTDIQWPMLGQLESNPSHRHLEPKESDTFHFDYPLNAPVEMFMIYSYVRNLRVKPTRRARKDVPEIGWMKTDIVSIAELGQNTQMKNNQNQTNLETRQGTPTSSPVVVSNPGTKQGTPTAPPTPVVPQNKK